MNQISGFVAYPSSPPTIGQAIEITIDALASERSNISLTGWPDNDIAGHFIIDPILDNISESDILVADITRPNFNVTYEIGYAIGKMKRVVLIRNGAITGNDDLVKSVGIFDTLGHKTYHNSRDLAAILKKASANDPLPFDANSVNSGAPLYIVIPRRTEFEIRLIARIKKSGLQYRSFDEEEFARLPANEAIDNVAQSHGVVVPLLSSDRVNSQVHNLRAAFVAGLGHGMNKIVLLLQDGSGPIPLDLRDFVKDVQSLAQIDTYISDFAPEVSKRLQLEAAPVTSAPKTFLEELKLGSSFAENEFQELAHYYIETDEYRRALSGEVRIVAGRKGAGKTALFAQVVNKLRQDRLRVVVDLRPEGFQLLKFKERVLDFLDVGTKEHTITAFWEYLLLLECCHKMLKNDEVFHTRSNRLYAPYRLLADAYEQDEYVSEGDFSERMLKLTRRIAEDFALSGTEKERYMSSGEITQLLYKHDLNALRNQVMTYLQNKSGLWILFDNLDKGWPPNGVGEQDVLSLRCLTEAMTKIEREMRRREIEGHGIIFIRNDVYELLVENTPDRGKISRVSLDWSDPALMRELLRQRFVYSDTVTNKEVPFEEIWRQVVTPHVKGEESSQYLIERSLMRPRALIELFRACRSHAVNLGHSSIEPADIAHGEANYSRDLLESIGYEIGDVFPAAADVLYEFIALQEVISGTEISAILGKYVPDNSEEILRLLLWYGVIGVVRDNGDTSYIYSVLYDSKRLWAIVKQKEWEHVSFRINPAFWTSLEIVH